MNDALLIKTFFILDFHNRELVEQKVPICATGSLKLDGISKRQLKLKGIFSVKELLNDLPVIIIMKLMLLKLLFFRLYMVNNERSKNIFLQE